MTGLPRRSPAADRFGHSVVVVAAVHELRRFAGNIDRERAAVLLAHYHGYGALSDGERTAVLARFLPAVRGLGDE